MFRYMSSKPLSNLLNVRRISSLKNIFIEKNNFKKIYFNTFILTTFVITPLTYNIVFQQQSKKTPTVALLNSLLVSSCFGIVWPITIPYGTAIIIDALYNIYKIR